MSARHFISGTASQKETRQAIHDTVTGTTFVNLLTKPLTILKHINNTIKFYQSDSVPISEVYALFANKLPNSTMSMPLISPEEHDYMLKLIHHRFDFMYRDAHWIAYLLDPRFVGVGMPVALREQVEEMIYQHNIPAAGSETSDQLMEAMFTN